MNRTTAISVLAVAALLESGGDALIRIAIQDKLTVLMRVLLFLGAAAVLTGYGWTLNAPAWDFGKLIGIYVAVFFVVGQMISWLVFKQQPSLSAIIAGVMIGGGGVVFTVGNR